MIETGPRDAVEPLLQTVRELAEQSHPGIKIERISLDDSLEGDLGIDSLARAELLVRLEERFKVSLPDEVVLEAGTVGNLLEAVRQAHCPERSRRGLGGRKRGGEEAFIPPAIRAEAPEPAKTPEQAATLADVLEWHAQNQPDRVHLTLYQEGAQPDPLTYRQLLAGAQAIAGGLRSYNLNPGETVALMLPTCRDYFTAFFGVLLAGAVPVPLYPPQRAERLEEHARRQAGILKNSQSRILISEDRIVPFGKLLKSLSPDIAGVVTPGGLRQAGRPPMAVKLKAGDTALLQYTSGSTGDPKGVILSHRQILANIRAIAAATGTRSTDICISWLPLYHDMGLIGAWLGSLYTAMRLVIMPPAMFLLRPQRWLRAIHRERGTVSSAPNFAYELCASKISDKDLKGLDLSSWRLALNGSEPVSADTNERFCRRFGPYGFRRESLMPVYGLAECSLGLVFPPVGRPPVADRIKRAEFYGQGKAAPAGSKDDAVSFVSCGYPLPGYEVRIVDELNHEAPERQVGRLQFLGPSTTSGYYRNPEATRRLFHGNWLDSGDFAYVANGEVFLTGRAKDLIIKGGRNIHPLELEKAVERVPDVRLGSVAVIGSPDPKSGTERLVVVAETRLKDPGRLEELRRKVQGVTADILDMPPDDVVLVPPQSVPKTPAGKIRRNACRRLYESGEIGRAPRSPAMQRLSMALASFQPLAFRFGRFITSYLYAGYAWFSFSLLALLSWLAAMAIPGRWLRGSAIRRLCKLFFRTLGIPIVVEGQSNLPDKTCVAVANHASYVDALVLSAALPERFRFVAKKEFRRNWFLGPLLRRLGAQFVERFEPKAGVRDTADILESVRKGTSIVVFPEGTFRREPGLKAFRLGAFLVACRAGAPVAPIAIRGSRSILRGSEGFPRRGAVHVAISSPLQPHGASWDEALDLSGRARREILRHCGEPDLSQGLQS